MTKKEILHEILSTSIYILFVLLFTFLIVKFVGQRTEVVGASMESTLHDGDNLIVDKISYRFREPERFDIIVFPYQYAKKTYYIKRIIGLPGETVQIDEYGIIYINGQVLVENYGKDTIKNPGLAENTIHLGEGEYFVLGDNRNNSTDSRDPSVGTIRKKDILGRAWLQIWPLNKMHFVKHKEL